MSDFKSRLSIEKSELDEKIGKLSTFIESDGINSIDPKQKALLNEQLPAMKLYAYILAERISLLT